MAVNPPATRKARPAAEDTSAPATGAAEDVTEQPSGDAVTAAVAGKAATAGEEQAPEAANEEGASRGVLLHIVPSLSIWRGDRHFVAGKTVMIWSGDVDAEQLQRILNEPAFVCTPFGHPEA